MTTMEKDWNLANAIKLGLDHVQTVPKKFNKDSFYREYWFNNSFWFRMDALAFEINYHWSFLFIPVGV